MSYELPDIRIYDWMTTADQTFGATTIAHYIVGPKGKVGFVRDILVEVTTSLVGTTSVPEIDVGISSGDATYGRYRLGTSIGTGLGVGSYSASDEPDIVGNPPRLGTLFSNHVVLDGGPLTSAGISGGTYLTVVPQGRIPPAGMVIVGVNPSTGSPANAIYLRDPIPPQLVTGQLVNVVGVQGATSVNGSQLVIASINTTYNYITISGGSYGGTYTSGGVINPVTVVTGKQGSGGSPAGGGNIRVIIQWIGQNTP
jgi:hypothetical protein